MPDWLDLGDVKSFLGLTPADVFDDEALANAVRAAEPFVERARPDSFPRAAAGGPDFSQPPSSDPYFAAMQLAARLYGRRNSANGVAAFDNMGGPVYVSRYDPDIERGLRIGIFARPVVG